MRNKKSIKLLFTTLEKLSCKHHVFSLKIRIRQLNLSFNRPNLHAAQFVRLKRLLHTYRAHRNGHGVGIWLILFSQGRGYLNISSHNVEIFDCRLVRKRLFPASTLHACAVRFEKIRKSSRPMRTSESWVDFTVLSSNFVCFSVFLINWTS